MTVSVKDALRNEGERYDISFSALMEPVDYMGRVEFENVKVDGFYFAQGAGVRFIGKINVDCIFECDRCLKPFKKSFTLDFDQVYSANSEEEMYLLQKNDTVDFQPLLNDTVLSALPIERLCREDCKGLCPHCGIDKNFSSCSCETETDEDNPFAVLKGLVD